MEGPSLSFCMFSIRRYRTSSDKILLSFLYKRYFKWRLSRILSETPQKCSAFKNVVNVTYYIKINQHYSFNAHSLLHLEPDLTQNTLHSVPPFYCVFRMTLKTKRHYLRTRNSATLLYNGRNVLYDIWTRTLYIMSTQITNWYTSFWWNTGANTLTLIQHKSDPQAIALRGCTYKHDT
jgi:hypothetical protein